MTNLYFSAFLIISLELILMVYIFMLQPKLRSNQLFAVYMLLLALSSYNSLVANTASDVTTVFHASVVHLLATLVAGPLLWLLLFHAFLPQHRVTYWVSRPLWVMIAVPLVLGLADWLTTTEFLFGFKPDLSTDVYVPLRQTLNGRFGSFFYIIYISILNSLLILPISWFAFSRMLSVRLRRAARVLLLFFILVGLLYLPWLNLSPALRNMLPPVFAALGAAWVMNTYRFFSSMELAMKQVIDTVTIGLLVFDETLCLIDANAFSVKILPINLPQDKHKLTLPQLFQRLEPDVENRAELLQFQTVLQLKPQQGHQQEVVLRNGRSPDNLQLTWLLFNARPVYDSNQIFLGLSCSLEDLTIERRTQVHIGETHKAIEQYAYNQTLLNDITQAAISAFDFDANLSVLAKRLTDYFGADSCCIFLWDEAQNRVKPMVAYGIDMEQFLSLIWLPGEPSLANEVCRLRQAMPIEDINQSAYVSQRIAQLFPTRGMLALPMVADEYIVGAIQVGFNQPRAFTPEEVKWGEQIARQLTLAIYKNRLLASEREQRVLLEALQAAGQAMISTLDFEQVLDRVLEEIAHVVPYDTANFALINKGYAYIVRRRRFDQNSSEPAVNHLVIAQMPTLQTMFETKRPLLIPNTTKSDKWVQMVGQVKSWLGVPLIVSGELIAFLMVDKLEPDFYQPRHEAWLTAFASQAALALQNAQLFTEIQRRVTELEALSQVSTALRSSDTVPVILQSVIETMVNVLSARVGVAFLLDETGTAVVSQASYPADYYPIGIHYALGEGITGYVAQTRKLHITKELNLDPRTKFNPDEPEGVSQLRSTIALPLISEDGILGVIHLGLDIVYDFADDEIRTLKAMSNIVANGLQRIQVMQTLEARVASRTYDLETANDRLQELDKLKTKFIADVSHELRTPVANLSIYIDLLQHGNPEKQAHYLSVLQQQATRLTNLVEATLGLSRLEIGSQNFELGSINLNQIVKEILLGHQARAEAFGLHLQEQLQSDLPPVFGNQIQLSQLVTNLVTNAINYNRPGGYINVQTFVAEKGMVCLTVTDNGMGISETDLPYLFDRFYRGQRTGQSNIPGTGLGLAIVKEIVDLHHGRIEVTSHQDKGSSFLVHLPIYSPQSLGTGYG